MVKTTHDCSEIVDQGNPKLPEKSGDDVPIVKRYTGAALEGSSGSRWGSLRLNASGYSGIFETRCVERWLQVLGGLSRK